MITSEHRFPDFRAISSVVALAFCWMPPGAHASDRKPSLKLVTEALDQMNDDFCQTFKLKCPAKGKPVPKGVETSKAKQTQTSPSKVSTGTKSTAATAPIPRQKPNRATLERAVALEAPTKPSLPPPAPKTVQGDMLKSSPVSVAIPTPKPAQPAKPDNRVSSTSQTKRGAIELVSVPLTVTGVEESCLMQLKSAGVSFDTALAPTDGQNCQIETPVRMLAVETTAGSIMLPEKPLLNCKFALQFSLWLSDAAAPGVAARKNAKLANVAT